MDNFLLSLYIFYIDTEVESAIIKAFTNNVKAK